MLPESDAYKRLDQHILWNVYNFSPMIKTFQRYLSSFVTIRAKNDVENMLISQTIKLGLSAAELAEQLRNKYGLLQQQAIKEGDESIPEYFLNNFKQLKMLEQRHRQVEP